MIFARFSIAAAALLGASVAGCGGAGGGRPAGPDIGAPQVPFARKTRSEKQAFMGSRVLPKMREVFQSFDAKGYEKFDCATCHGADMEAVDFHMPNSLYALPAEDTLKEAADYDEKTTTFMKEHVVPAMAALLSKKVGSPEHPEERNAVTCFTCHPHE